MHKNLTYDMCACVMDEDTQEIPDSQRFVGQISLELWVEFPRFGLVITINLIQNEEE